MKNKRWEIGKPAEWEAKLKNRKWLEKAVTHGSFLSQLRVNQDDLEAEMTLRIQEEEEEAQRQLLQQTTPTPTQSNKTQLRANVVNEIITAEAEYVKHLRDVIEVSGVCVCACVSVCLCLCVAMCL